LVFRGGFAPALAGTLASAAFTVARDSGAQRDRELDFALTLPGLLRRSGWTMSRRR